MGGPAVARSAVGVGRCMPVLPVCGQGIELGAKWTYNELMLGLMACRSSSLCLHTPAYQLCRPLCTWPRPLPQEAQPTNLH